MSQNEIKTVVNVDRLFLATDNPRHEEVDDEREAIERLCKSEYVEELARDIVLNGPSPAERLIVYPADESLKIDEVDEQTAFVVAEGNRRVCALKLLNDPDRAPVKLRDAITKMADGREISAEVDVVVMIDPERRRHWMRRIHDGVQGGKGRKPWNAEQKTRFSGSRRNIIAQQLFDFAERRGLMEEADRRGNFSHMARLVGNVLVSETLGLDLSNGIEELQRNRPIKEFETILAAVLREAKDKALGSQASKAKIDRFARDLNKLSGVSVNRIDPEGLEPEESDHPSDSPNAQTTDVGDRDAGNGVSETSGGGASSKSKSKKYVIEESSISDGFEDLNHDKLMSLYKSICSINCETHTPLIAVGVWSFVETLAATMGSDKPFKDFFTRGKTGKLAALGLGYGQDANAVVEALARIAGYGNTTKHDAVSAFFDYRQVINDMKVLSPLVEACISELKQDA